MVTESLPMGFAGVPAAFVGCVAFHDGPVQLFYQGGDQGGLQEVVSAWFAGGDLDGDLSMEFPAQGFIDLYEAFRGDLFCKIYSCLFHGIFPFVYRYFMSNILNGMVFYVKEIYHVMIILLLRAYIHGIVEWWIRFFLVYFLTLWHNISKKFLQERGICK